MRVAKAQLDCHKLVIKHFKEDPTDEEDDAANAAISDGVLKIRDKYELPEGVFLFGQTICDDDGFLVPGQGGTTYLSQFIKPWVEGRLSEDDMEDLWWVTFESMIECDLPFILMGEPSFYFDQIKNPPTIEEEEIFRIGTRSPKKKRGLPRYFTEGVVAVMKIMESDDIETKRKLIASLPNITQ